LERTFIFYTVLRPSKKTFGQHLIIFYTVLGPSKKTFGQNLIIFYTVLGLSKKTFGQKLYFLPQKLLFFKLDLTIGNKWFYNFFLDNQTRNECST
jgi:hypothetical protein